MCLLGNSVLIKQILSHITAFEYPINHFKLTKTITTIIYYEREWWLDYKHVRSDETTTVNWICNSILIRRLSRHKRHRPVYNNTFDINTWIDTADSLAKICYALEKYPWEKVVYRWFILYIYVYNKLFR